MYNNFIGYLNEVPDDYSLIKPSLAVKNRISHSYDEVRFGLPTGAVDFDKVKEERNILIKHFNEFGMAGWPYSKITPKFRSHIALFRAQLDFWEQFSKSQVFCKAEIYYRCLTEGHSFTELIKKMRATCFRHKTSETNTIIDEELISDRYDGYNSIIHERYLIHWDDREEVDDVKYAFIAPSEESNADRFRALVNEFWDDFKLDENLVVPHEFDSLGALKNTKMYDPIRKKTSLMREFWDKSINCDSPYFAKRTVVLTSPGSTRDTGVGDPSTILKVKHINAIARSMSEVTPYSVNCDQTTANARYKRVLKNNLFLHLDFKKFGLTFPRELMNVLLEEYGKRTGLDTSPLIIHDFFVEIDGEIFRTERGTMLGWLDSINSLCVSIILHSLGKEAKFDHVTFNDDVEISKKGLSAPSETLELLRDLVIVTMASYDIPVSLDKTFGSKCSVFLERYVYYDEYDIDMYKEQLTVKAYANSCVATEPWQAKVFFSAAEQWTKSEYARDRCIDTCPIEFRKDEIHLPLFSGGWYIRRKKGLDLALVESDSLGIRLGIELSRYKPPRYATKIENPSSNKAISSKIFDLAYRSQPPSIVRNRETIDSIEVINNDIEVINISVGSRAAVYSGRNIEFPQIILRLIDRQQKRIFDGGGESARENARKGSW